MALTRALGSAISGLENFQTAIDVIGSNIANVNTTGYKSSVVSFQDAISQIIRGATPPGTTTGGTNPFEIGLGANIASTTPNFTQGQLQLTGTPTDIAINGPGFFVLTTPSGQQFTRDGHFAIDSNQNMVDANGNIIQWFGATNGVVNTSALSNANIPLGKLSIARKTTTETFGGNFNSSSPIAPAPGSSFNVSTTVYDSLGNAHNWIITFTDLGPGGAPPGDSNQWSFSIAGDAGTAFALGTNTGVIDFTNTGTVDTVNSTGGGAPVPIVTAYFDKAQVPQNITFNFTAFTQLNGQTTAAVTNQDGVALGTLNNFTVGQNGIVTGSFTNGLQQVLGQIALANFTNPQGLQSNGSLFLATPNSGQAQINAPETGGLGATIGGALESSNVDLSKEFTNLIVSQRAFEANARIITTSDTVLGDLIQAMGGV